MPPAGRPAAVRSVQASTSQIPLQSGSEAKACARCCGVNSAEIASALASIERMKSPIILLPCMSSPFRFLERLAVRPCCGHIQSAALAIADGMDHHRDPVSGLQRLGPQARAEHFERRAKL